MGTPHFADQNKRPFTVERAGERQRFKQKPKRWSHQAELEAGRGKSIVVAVKTDGLVSGLLMEVDQFTIKLSMRTYPQNEDSPRFDRVIFKSSIIYFNFEK